MEPRRCPDCGNTRRLAPNGACAWRSGCEHRQMVYAARMAELDRLLTPAPCPVEPLIEIAVRHLAAATDEAHQRGLLPPDYAFLIPEITFDPDP